MFGIQIAAKHFHKQRDRNQTIAVVLSHISFMTEDLGNPNRYPSNYKIRKPLRRIVQTQLRGTTLRLNIWQAELTRKSCNGDDSTAL